ncbi:MAG: prolipoprotein diacylglyceryl transferase [Spirochaetaceae bacterium]|jgi:phosphatidylglycerol:prolipoprotein diacylglycerol transferase|nr:prolipoprotein diacylglyceryl transferase [Spirochaetaceae bacterium]
MLLIVNYPSWIHPEIFPGVPFLSLLRWYGLMYVFAFGAAYMVLRRICREGVLGSGVVPTGDDVINCFTTGIVGLLLGARIFSALVYDTSGMYLAKPWLIFWPFDGSGHFTGLAGMSYHGGYIGGFLGILFWCLRHKQSALKWMDALVIAIPAGYTFGRLGNFLNGELFGRITTVPWGMLFPSARRFSLSLGWVRQFAEEAGLDIAATGGTINLPRHPSQLYEAFFEGIFLFTLLWAVRKRKPFDGFMCALYSMGYGMVRFVIEYFREPDAEIGYRITRSAGAVTYRNESLGNISTGQILCLLMIAGGLTFLILGWRNTKKNTAIAGKRGGRSRV